LNYKYNPVICVLHISPRDGLVKKVSFLINHEIASLITNEDIVKFNDIILNTRFHPDETIDGDIIPFSLPLSRKRIKDFLEENSLLY